ncbi:MAG: nitrate/sulfonate/bicarbonate ABC transporter ATP-binding protein [Thiomonas sp.]|uniref:ABC transporter ATP-binding protein n=1 Tax=Thiomonas sp. TaxID=2047785 RepID=UPI002A3701EB|nr:nitrate/sulfonate/bicarbonate ABC transporter ATP-binding protein [Thiomonas sp.]MDY0329371.1 nitrate/sulfonate/bicarbonate ABC transporter ATP-binding protein [Thiomonas sp.]
MNAVIAQDRLVTSADPIFQLSGVRKSYRTSDGSELVILDGVDLELRDGEILVLLGRSGSGKSTLLRILAGLVPATGGSALHRGEPIDGPVPGLAMVFQSFALFPWLTVLQNVELGLEALKVPPAERRARALAAIDLIGLDGFESAYPRELSGGMRQRVGFARALVINPDVLLMDEPFSALDVLTAETLRTDLLDLWAERKIPTRGILLVSHNIEEAVLMADRIVILGSNPGRVISEMRIDLSHPRERESQQFRDLVESIYGAMTARPTGRDAVRKQAPGIGLRLPTLSVNALAGLLEELDALEKSSANTRISLPELAEDMHFSVDDLFPLIEGAELLGFAQAEEGDIMLLPAGRLFVDGTLQERKELFARHLIERVPLVARIRAVLDERYNHRAPDSRFLTELEDYLSEDEARRVLDTAIDWGRYAELYAYDDNAEVFSLDNPEADLE